MTVIAGACDVEERLSARVEVVYRLWTVLLLTSVQTRLSQVQLLLRSLLQLEHDVTLVDGSVARCGEGTIVETQPTGGGEAAVGGDGDEGGTGAVATDEVDGGL